MKLKEEQKKKEEEKDNLKENYLRQIYNKSNPALADKLLKISDSLDFGKEEEFSVFKEEKDFSKTSVILIPPLLQSDHEISREHDRYVSRKGIIGQAVAF